MMTKEEKRRNRTIRRRGMLLGTPALQSSSRVRAIQRKSIYDLSNERKRVFYLSNDWKTLKDWLFKRLRCQCVCCRGGKNLQVDHIFPISKSPELALDFKNIQYLCAECNSIKSNNTNKRFCAYTRNGASKSFYPPQEEIDKVKSRWDKYFPKLETRDAKEVRKEIELFNFFA